MLDGERTDGDTAPPRVRMSAAVRDEIAAIVDARMGQFCAAACGGDTCPWRCP